MCRNVIIHAGKGKPLITIEKQSELIAAMPNGVIYMNMPVPILNIDMCMEKGHDPECCLCPVDLKATAELNNIIYSRYASEEDEINNDDDFFDDHFYLEK